MQLLKKELKERSQFQPSNLKEVIEASDNMYTTGDETYTWNGKAWIQFRCFMDGYQILPVNGLDLLPVRDLKQIPLKNLIIVKYKGGGEGKEFGQVGQTTPSDMEKLKAETMQKADDEALNKIIELWNKQVELGQQERELWVEEQKRLDELLLKLKEK